MEELKKRIQVLKEEITSIDKQLSDLESQTELTLMNTLQTSKAKIKWDGGVDSTYILPRLDIVTTGTVVVSENVQSGFLRSNTLIKTTIDGQPLFILASKAHTP